MTRGKLCYRAARALGEPGQISHRSQLVLESSPTRIKGILIAQMGRGRFRPIN
jgi:hypothetical protein